VARGIKRKQKKRKLKKKKEGNETQGTAINMLLKGILDDNDIQGHTEDQKITQEPEGISPVSW
jgi:hypothetical protein